MGPTLQVLVPSGIENEVSTQGAALGAMDMMEKLIFQKRHNCQVKPNRCDSPTLLYKLRSEDSQRSK